MLEDVMPLTYHDLFWLGFATQNCLRYM